MNRNYVAIVVGIISLGLFIFAANFVAPQTDYHHAKITNEEYNSIISSHKKADDSILKDLKFNSQKVYYAEQDNTWYYSIIEGNKDAYNPRINTNGNSKLRIAFKDYQNIDEQTIASAKTLDFIAYNDDYYSEHKLAVTTLPIIAIDHEDEILSDDDIEMEFELFDNRKNALKRITQTAGKIHIRGKSSATFEKKSYRLNLRNKSPGEHDRNANEPLLGMREDDDWILFANYHDNEKIRQTLNSQLAKDSSGYGTENRFVEVINNSKYEGLYTLSTTIDAKTLGFQKDSDGNYIDYLFKKWHWGRLDTEQGDEAVDSYELKTEKISSEKDAWKTLRSYLKHTETEYDHEYATTHTDIDSAIDHILLTELSANIDSANGSPFIKNILYAIRHKDSDYIVSYIPWDFDISWGTGYIIDALDDTSYQVSPDSYIDYSPLTIGKLAENDEEIREKIKTRYQYLRQNVWTDDYINNLLNSYQKDIFNSGAFKREKERWPDGYYSHDELDSIRTYINKRLEYCDYWFELREDEPEPLETL